MNTYLIRGFTGPNPDFSFKLHAPDYPTGLDLRDVVLGHFDGSDCDYDSYMITVDLIDIEDQ